MQLDDEPVVSEQLHGFVEMGAITGLDNDVEHGSLGRQVGKNPLVCNLDDVGSGLTQDVGHTSQMTGLVDEFDQQTRQAPLASEIARQHAGQQARVDIAAAQDRADLIAYLKRASVRD